MHRHDWLLNHWSLAGWLLVCLCGSVHGQGLTGEVANAAWGVRFTVPDGWTGMETGNGYLLTSTTRHGFVLIGPHAFLSRRGTLQRGQRCLPVAQPRMDEREAKGGDEPLRGARPQFVQDGPGLGRVPRDGVRPAEG